MFMCFGRKKKKRSLCFPLAMIVLLIVVTAIVLVCFSALGLSWRESLKELGDDRRKNIMFVTAHPDDECMFFAPSILNMPQHNIYLLCLSNGNFYGEGELRSQELLESSMLLGIKEQNIFVEDHHELRDDPKLLWNSSVVSEVVGKYAERYDVDVLVTFDEQGVSGHLNHIGVHMGVKKYLESQSNVVGYKLLTVNVVRKYSSVFDIPVTYLTSSSGAFLSRPFQVSTARSAMNEHESQMTWFRHLYILFSRYMYINDLLPFD